MNLAAHQNELLADGRCAYCAERVKRAEIVRVGECPHCGSTLRWSGGDVLDDLESRQLRWRLLGYLLVAAASFVAGAIPLLQVGVQLGALFVLHVVVLRRGLQWLPPGRRVLARITIKIFGAALATVALLINVAIAPLVGLSAFILAGVGPLLTAAYVEGGLVILRRRLRWEAERKPLRFSEWALPIAFLVALLGAMVGTIATAMGVLHVLANTDIPSVREFAQTLLEYSS